MSKSESGNKDNDSLSDIIIDEKTSQISLDLFKSWLVALSGTGLAEWDRLPDIGLYMDQVLTLMDRQLAFYKRAEEDRLLTHPMINNYTKDGLLPRASDKKYSQGHLAFLSVLCSLKPVLSISDLSALLQNVQIKNEEQSIYEFFLETQKAAIDHTSQNLLPELDLLSAAIESGTASSDTVRRELALMALKMAVEARVRIMMTQKILDLINTKK